MQFCSNTVARETCRWLGVLAVLSALTGCDALMPNSSFERPGTGYAASSLYRHNTAAPVVPAGYNGSPSSNTEKAVAPAKYDGPANTIIVQARFGGPATTADNQELPPAQPAERMTFDQAVSATLMADPKIRAGFEAIVQAKGDLVTSSLPPNPTLLVDGLMLPTRAVTPDRTSGPTQTDAFVSYPIDWFLFGKRAAAMASARLGVRQSEADYSDLVRQRVAACAAAFYDLVEAKELLKLAHEDVANLKKIAAITEKAVKAGNRTKVDMERVRLDMLKSEQSVRDAESTVAVAKAKLRSLLGRSDADPAFDVVADIDAPLARERMPLEQAFTLATENRPDIQSLQTQVAKADADIVVENRKRFPEVSPAIGYTRQFQGPALAQPDADSWNVSLTTTLPFINRNQGNRMKAQSVAVQNRFTLESALADLRAEVTQVSQELETAEKNAHAIAQDQKKAAKDVLDAITKSYEIVGGRPYVDVLDAQRAYRDTYRAYISSRANYWRAVYRFSAAIGKQITP